jgi:hypothetical protein
MHSFPQFPRLPLEVRRQIWRIAAEDYLVFTDSHEKTDDLTSTIGDPPEEIMPLYFLFDDLPGVLLANRESYESTKSLLTPLTPIQTDSDIILM